MNKIQLENETMSLSIDGWSGVIDSLQLKEDLDKTEYAGSLENISYPAIRKMGQWMGDIKFRVWDGKKHVWREEITSCSDDNRKVVEELAGKKVTVTYRSPSEKEKGIRSVTVTENYCLQPEGLYWEISVKNISGGLLEIGEISLPFVTNADFTGIFENPQYEENEQWRGIKQKLWHEQRVQQHLSIDGGSSYVFMQKPKGDFPGLLFQVLDDGKLEEAYQMDSEVGCQWSVTFEGPYYLSLYSSAAKKCGGWKQETEQQSYGINGNTALLLKEGQEKHFRFLFREVHSVQEMRDFLYEEGQLDIAVQPSMVVPVEIPVRMRIRCKNRPVLIPVANNMTIEQEKTEGDNYYYRLVFTEPGQKKIKVVHGDKVTTVLFYTTDTVRKLLENHAEFITKRQYYNNPQDPFGRHHAFLPYDDALEMIFTESEESWQVGALDEYALPVAMFLAEKNTVLPQEDQISVLEEYIEDCLYGKLQERETYYARRGMYYEEQTPSDLYTGNKWDREKAESILRSFNYPLISDIYFSMYKIGKKYGLTKVRDKETYLEMAYRTAMTGYELGKNKFNGAPAGATVIEILKVLKEEQPVWYEKLNEKVFFIAEENASSEYPFGSELYVDQTSHNQYEAMMKYYGKKEKLEEAYRITCALRNGQQPEWFLYGNEKRGNVCCWYGTPLNSRVLFDGYEYTDDMEMLRLGIGGLFSFLTCIRSNGAAHGWYLCWPDRSGFDLRSLDTDMGMYGYLYAAKSYVADDEIFGRCGYGCLWEKEHDIEIIRPYDGLGIRFCSIPHGIEVECKKGCIKKILLQEKEKKIVIEMEKPYGTESSLSIRTKVSWTVEADGSRVQTNPGTETTLCGKGR